MSREVKWPHPGEILMEEWLAPMRIEPICTSQGNRRAATAYQMKL